MTVLSVNINKIATLRNSRGHDFPNLLRVASDILSYGAKSLTVHPRPDERHIKKKDAYDLGQWIHSLKDVEFNIEGYPSPDFLRMVLEIKPHQCTLVPDPPEALTSNSGWNFTQNMDLLKRTNKKLTEAGIRTSLFLDPFTFNEKELLSLKEIGAQRIELYTEAYSKSYSRPNLKQTMAQYVSVANTLKEHNFGINAGHDLNQENLGFLLQNIPQIAEVSIGHALIVESLYEGLRTTIQKYLKICHSK
jgi:pyridoxine 5-phosphate synthase